MRTKMTPRGGTSRENAKDPAHLARYEKCAIAYGITPKQLSIPLREILCRNSLAAQPADAFYHVKSPRNTGGYRLSAYCKRHTKARNARAAREAPAGSGIRASRERARAAWRTRNPERWKAIMRGVMRRRKATAAKTYSNWVKANKTKRKASQQAWYRRRKQRTPEQ